MMTSRERVLRTLELRSPDRAPRQLWALPWAVDHHSDALDALRRDFPDDISGVSGHWSEMPATSGNPYEIGTYVDDWGSVFTNIQKGVIGEVKDPLIADWRADVPKVHIPTEWLTVDRDAVNRDCAATTAFTMAGACPRPFEQLQFLRGTENLYIDLMEQPAEMVGFLASMHSYYCDLLEAWAATDVDALMMMDDWGTQRTLLLSPKLWRAVFKPLYRDYIEIAHRAGKKMFMHSDGHILSVIPDLIELGLDAVNSQVFCMGIENLAPYAGKITFWGEVDRQHLLPSATTHEIDAAVRTVHQTLWRQGGCIAQCEFGAGARPENVRQVFETWDQVTA